MDLQLIKNLCEKREGGVRGLALSIGMTEQNLHRCIRTNKIQAQDLERIAKELGVRVGYFFDEEEVVVKKEFRAETHGLAAEHIDTVDNRDFTDSAEVNDLKEQVNDLSKKLIEAQAKIISLMEK